MCGTTDVVLLLEVENIGTPSVLDKTINKAKNLSFVQKRKALREKLPDIRRPFL